MILSIFSFLNIFFNRFCPLEKSGLFTLLLSWFINLKYSIFKCFYLTQFSTFTFRDLPKFSKAFFSQVVLESFLKLSCYSICSSTYNFLSPILVSDWSVFDTSLKKRNKNDKNIFFYKKRQEQQKKAWTRPTDPWCNMLETLEIQRKYR